MGSIIITFLSQGIWTFLKLKMTKFAVFLTVLSSATAAVIPPNQGQNTGAPGQGAGANANTGTPNQQQNWGGWGRPTGQAPWGWPNQQPQQPAQQMDPNMMIMLMMVMNKDNSDNNIMPLMMVMLMNDKTGDDKLPLMMAMMMMGNQGGNQDMTMPLMVMMINQKDEKADEEEE